MVFGQFGSVETRIETELRSILAVGEVYPASSRCINEHGKGYEISR